MSRGLILIHGRGGSGRDMRGLIAPLGAEDWAVATPEAPGNSWWPTSFLAPMSQMQAPLASGLSALDAAIEGLGLPRAQIGIVGFSQGACLALEYAARRGAGLGAVVALSGGLIGTGDAEATPDPELMGHGPKMFEYLTDLTGLGAVITCHEQDPHIPLVRARASAEVLERQNSRVTFIAHPGAGHQPMADGIAAAQVLLQTI